MHYYSAEAPKVMRFQANLYDTQRSAAYLGWLLEFLAGRLFLIVCSGEQWAYKDGLVGYIESDNENLRQAEMFK